MPEANVPGYADAVTQGPRRGLLWTLLRESTRDAHAQAEASLAPLAQPDSLARYAALLCVLWGFQAPLEKGLAQVPHRSRQPGASAHDRSKLPTLRHLDMS